MQRSAEVMSATCMRTRASKNKSAATVTDEGSCAGRLSFHPPNSPSLRCRPPRVLVASLSLRLTPRVRVTTRRAATRQELQDYLGAHKIQERLNDWLNEMVKERPAAPYAWLATRMRGGSAGALGPQSSVPELKSPAAKEAFGDFSRSWDYLMAYQGISQVSQGASAASAAPSGPGELLLSIEPSSGSSPLVLAIRPK